MDATHDDSEALADLDVYLSERFTASGRAELMDLLDAAGFRRYGPITHAQVDRAEDVFWAHKEEAGESWGAMRAALESVMNTP